MDRISLHRLVFYTHHGVHAAEKELGQVIEIDVDLRYPLHAAGHSDSLENTLNYAEAYRIIKETVTQVSYNLLEALAETLAERLLRSTIAHEVTLRVRKPLPPIGGPAAWAEIEITRSGIASQ
jgi:7,8-dihydroneopterin aldolase/epimerase/oxygenase